MAVVFSVGAIVFLMGSFLFTKDSISGKKTPFYLNILYTSYFYIGDDFQVGNEGTTDDSMYRQQPRYFEKLGTCTAFFLENFFTRWGTFFASHPWLTLFGGALVVVILGSGITLVKITTDPVQLWASPTSKSRMEREFFDSTFEPFFRIEQVS